MSDECRAEDVEQLALLLKAQAADAKHWMREFREALQPYPEAEQRSFKDPEPADGSKSHDASQPED